MPQARRKPYLGTLLEGFDPEFYVTAYPDLTLDNDDARIHYIEHGRAERRYGSEARLAADIEIVTKSGKFDTSFYLAEYGATGDAVRHYLLNASYGKVKPNADFDADFFQIYYRQSLMSGENPFAYYCRHADKAWCAPNAKAMAQEVEALKRSTRFDAERIESALPREMKGVSPYLYYLTEGFRLGLRPSNHFDGRAYILEYPDIALAQINPLLHYDAQGSVEQRKAFAMTAVRVLPGKRAKYADRPTIIICSHEASRTGAPLVGLNLMRELHASFNIVAFLLRPGVLLDAFSEFAVEVVIAGDTRGDVDIALTRVVETHKPECAVLNSVEAVKLIDGLCRNGVGVITLIHDFAQYVRPAGLTAKAVTLSDLVVFPAELVRDATLNELRKLGLDAQPRNIEVRHQGRSMVPQVGPVPRRGSNGKSRLDARLKIKPNAPRPLVVLGAGWVQPRKGVDLFIEAARITKNELGVDCRFVWVGANYHPEEDMGLSVYLADQIAKSGLQDVVVMVEEQANLQPFWDASDAFFMSSRLDPFPNVALDAISEGIPVVCFDGATGIAELARDWPEQVQAASYNDAATAARLIATMGARPKTPPPAALIDRLSFSRYATYISERIGDVTAAAGDRSRLKASLLSDDRFDPDLFNTTLTDWLKNPGLGGGMTVDELAEKAVRAARAGLNVGLVRENRLSVLPPEEAAGIETAWSVPTHGIADTASERAVDHIVLTAEDGETLQRLAYRLYISRSKTSVTVLSQQLTVDDMATLAAVADPDRIALVEVDLNAPEAAVAALIARIKPDEIVEWRRTLDADNSASAASLAATTLASPAGVTHVLSARATAPHPGQACRSETSPLTPPRYIVDPAACWSRDAKSTPALAELLVSQMDDLIPSKDWYAATEAHTVKWALIRSENLPSTATFNVAFGRKPLSRV